MADTYEKKLPFSLEAEQSVLGSILIKPECINDTELEIGGDDFFIPIHAEIYYAMHDLFISSGNIDPVTLIEALVKRGVYKDEEAKKYIRLIVETVPTAANVKDYTRIVKEKSLLRKLIETCGEISEDAYSEQEAVSFVLESAERKIFDIAQGNKTKRFEELSVLIRITMEHLKLLAEDDESLKGINCGFSDIDGVLLGMGKGDLIIIGARPGVGKSALAMNIAANVALSTKKAVCIFTLEMSGEQIASRILSSQSLVKTGYLRSGKIPSGDWDKLARAAAFLAGSKILVDDTTNITVTGMKAKLRRVENLGLVIVDYLQLMESDKKSDSRTQEIGDISRNLKLMAKELRVPVIACAQLNRNAVNKGASDKRPLLSELRDSGSIEQDADVVMFIHREVVDNDTVDTKQAEIIIAKNRHGGTKVVKVNWDGETTRFYSQSNLVE